MHGPFPFKNQMINQVIKTTQIDCKDTKIFLHREKIIKIFSLFKQ